MTKRYTGGVVSSSLPTVNAAGASGVFLLSQQADYQSRNAWPPYKVEESLRFRSSASASLSRTPASASNRKTWTWSGWVKRGTLGVAQVLFGSRPSGSSNEQAFISFNSSNAIYIFSRNPSDVVEFTATTNAVFRDPSAWYHVLFYLDTTQNTSTNRMALYVNGVQQTFSSSTYPTQNLDCYLNQNVIHFIGSLFSDNYFDGYMSEVNFVDGQALTPSSFGATDKDGNWSPIAYTGTYGNNGFYVNFRDNTSATTMGYDYSGNGNNWTLSGFNVSTANTTYDIMIDVPEDQSDGTANNRGNYATFNPLEKGSNVTLSEGNLKYSTSSVSGVNGIVSMRISTGMKSYFEFTCGSVSLYRNISIGGMTYAGDSGSISGGTGGTGTFATWTTGDVIRFACDYNAGTIACYKNATLQTTVTGITNTSDWVINAAQSTNTTGEYTANFGQRPFAYEPPSGFKALNTFNLPEPTIKQPNKQFDVSLWTGNGSTQSITGLNFKPDLVWVKVRSSTQNHSFNDPLRGAGNYLVPNATAAERFQGEFTSFNSDGFSVTYNAAEGDYNFSGKTYVGWAWNAGNANTTNTSGSITSIVRANPTAGFSVVTYTGNGTGGATVGHGLGVAPSMVIVKRRNGVASWIVNHTSAGTGFLLLENTVAYSSATTYWTTAPTSSLLPTLTSNSEVNASGGTYVAYCFAPIAGYSAFGSYTGNGSTDGPFVYTGFRPKWILMKSTTETGLQWSLWDSSRIGYNPSNYLLAPQSSAAEDTTNSGSNSNGGPDFLSNGFKMRSNGGSHNSSGATYIYAAFAEAPFKYARSR